MEVQRFSSEPPGWPGQPQALLAGPGTPMDSKLHLFATKWVAIQRFGTSGPGFCGELRPRGRRDGPRISPFFTTILDPQNAQILFFANFLTSDFVPARQIWRPMRTMGSPWGSLPPHGVPVGSPWGSLPLGCPWGSHGDLRGFMWTP